MPCPYEFKCEEPAGRRRYERRRQLRSGGLAEVAPGVEAVAVFYPAVAYVCAVVHVGDQDVFDAGIDLGLGLLHGLAEADYYQNYSGGSGYQPLAVYLFHVFDVHFVGGGLFENDDGVLGEGIEGFIVVERKWRDDDAHADLESAADF